MNVKISLLIINSPTIPLPFPLQINSLGSFVTLHVHFVQNHVISVPPQHSVQSTGWPLVIIMAAW